MRHIPGSQFAQNAIVYLHTMFIAYVGPKCQMNINKLQYLYTIFPATNQ